jgi:hypothetical protein
MWISPSYWTRPSFLNLFMKKLTRDHSVDVDTVSGLGVRPPLPHENQAIRLNADFNLLNGLRTEHRTDELDDDVVLRLQNPAGERRKDFAFRAARQFSWSRPGRRPWRW